MNNESGPTPSPKDNNEKIDTLRSYLSQYAEGKDYASPASWGKKEFKMFTQCVSQIEARLNSTLGTFFITAHELEILLSVLDTSSTEDALRHEERYVAQRTSSANVQSTHESDHKEKERTQYQQVKSETFALYYQRGGLPGDTLTDFREIFPTPESFREAWKRETEFCNIVMNVQAELCGYTPEERKYIENRRNFFANTNSTANIEYMLEAAYSDVYVAEERLLPLVDQTISLEEKKIAAADHLLNRIPTYRPSNISDDITKTVYPLLIHPSVDEHAAKARSEVLLEQHADKIQAFTHIFPEFIGSTEVNILSSLRSQYKTPEALYTARTKILHGLQEKLIELSKSPDKDNNYRLLESTIASINASKSSFDFIVSVLYKEHFTAREELLPLLIHTPRLNP